MSLIQLRITPCLCLPIKGGTIFFASIAFFMSLILVFINLIWLVNDSSHDDDNFVAFEKVVSLFVSTSAVMFSIWLLIGVIMDKTTYMLPWLSMQFGSLILFGGCSLGWLLTGPLFLSRAGALIIFTFGMSIFAMYIYMFLVLLSYWQFLTVNKAKAKTTSPVYNAAALRNYETVDLS